MPTLLPPLRLYVHTGVKNALASSTTYELIARQISMLPQRKAVKNRLGLLRRSIEEDWGPPLTAPTQPVRAKHTEHASVTVDDYRHFLTEEALKLKIADQSLWHQFEAKESELRTTLATSSLVGPGVRERILREFDEELRREQRWGEFW